MANTVLKSMCVYICVGARVLVRVSEYLCLYRCISYAYVPVPVMCMCDPADLV